MGDKASLPIPSSVTMLTAGSSADACESGKCCWKGTTANTSYCDGNNGGYNGCTRTVCNWNAAQEICARFDLNGESWRLPTKTEMNGWNAHSLGIGAEGLQLCSNTSSTNQNYARCYRASNCYGAYQKGSFPAYIWSNEKYESGTPLEFQGEPNEVAYLSIRLDQPTEMDVPGYDDSWGKLSM